MKKQRKNSKIEIEVFFKVKENITNYVDISNANIDEMNKEMNKKEEWLGVTTIIWYNSRSS